MTSKLGFHIIEPYRLKTYDQAVLEAKPRVVKVVGKPEELGILTYYHEKNPSGIYIARIFTFEKAIADIWSTGGTPQQAADVMYNALSGFVHAASMEWCWWECGPNEPNIDESDEALVWIDDYYALLIPRLAASGIKSVSYNFSVCHPEFSAWPKLSRSLSAIRQAGPSLAAAGLHEYGGINGDIRTDADTQVLRHRRIQELQTIPIMDTESGREPGWQAIKRSAEDYYEDLVWLDQQLQLDGNVLCACLFTMDTKPDWQPFRIEGNLAVKLFEYMRAENASIVEVPPAPAPAPPPEPAVPGLPRNTVAIKTRSESGQNIRGDQSLLAPVVGDIDFGEVAYISASETGRLGQDKAWCYVKTFDGQEGWCGAWLLVAV